MEELIVGGKPFINYLTAANFLLAKQDKLTIRARGKRISRAVDLAEVLKRNNRAEVESIEIYTEEHKVNDETVRVSAIAIQMTSKA